MPRWFTRNDSWDFGGKPDPSEDEARKPGSRKRRLALTFVFTIVFFAGASFAAVAGSKFSASVQDDSALEATTSTSEESADAAPASDDAAAAAAPAAEESADAAAPASEAAPAAADASASSEPAEAADSDAGTADGGFTQLSKATSSGQAPAAASSGAASASNGKKGTRASAKASDPRSQWIQLRKVLLPKTKPAPKPEIEGPESAATIWLNSALPDPTPPALRLSPKFAANLKIAAKANGVNWAVMLGILRARGAKGHIPADRVTLGRLAARLDSFGPARGDWARIVSYSGDTRFADKAAALARYDRAVGLDALVRGLEAAKASLANRILSDRNISIYPGGRDDIINDRVDVRVLAMISYLRQSFGQVTVSCLISGHRLYARPGVISAHIPGHAADIASLGDTSIQGHQEPGGITERAVREILLLPAEVMPRQVISLLGLGGPSFPLADHYNHIHIGY
ncbi:MAG: hypothetical protein ACJ74D_02795 [Gaiellaceae bacterium]